MSGLLWNTVWPFQLCQSCIFYPSTHIMCFCHMYQILRVLCLSSHWKSDEVSKKQKLARKATFLRTSKARLLCSWNSVSTSLHSKSDFIFQICFFKCLLSGHMKNGRIEMHFTFLVRKVGLKGCDDWMCVKCFFFFFIIFFKEKK